ncbi:MAG: hypothetical protein NTV93_16725 [Verrucomicrobia bacterium]|nr:hypothetical protein [Verrucomicrobiota bacterium]
MPPQVEITSSTCDLATFGEFVSGKDAFRLENPPPRKWTNVHCTDPDPGGDEMYAEITNIGDGPVVVRDEAGNTCLLVGYDSKQLYLRDDDTNLVFCPGGEPAPQAVETKTVYSADCTVTHGVCDGIEAERRTFVPRHEAVEIWTIKASNRSGRNRKMSVFAYAMFQLTGTGSDGGGVWKDNHSEVRPHLGGVIVYNRDRSAGELGFNGCLISPQAIAGASGYRDFFTRSDFSLSTPKILWGWNCDNRGFRGPDCAGIVQVKLDLPDGTTGRVDFLIARCDSEEAVASLRSRWTPEAIDAAAADQRAACKERNAMFRVDTGHGPQDALINGFVKKQMVSYLVNKSGFRDNLQNDMGLALCDAGLVRANLLRAIASQNQDGSVPHSFRPWNLHHYSDKPAWMLHCVPWVLKETGDLAFLDEKLPYRDGGQAEPVWQHMLRAMRHLVKDTGAHGLCDQHFADWNDGLEPSEKTGDRESVMVTQQLCLGLREIAELARRRGEDAVVEECESWHAHFSKLLNDIAWDGNWYVRTLCSGGYTLGSDANPEGKIFINTQSWAVLSGTAPGDRARRCMESVDRMIETDFGFAIAEPAFTKFDERIGKFSASRPYYAENGGCYNHAAGFKLVADCMLGRAEEAWRTFLKVAPGSPWNPISNSCAEPFSFTNCYSRTHEWPGLSMYPWRTGTGAWVTMGLVEWILGARRHYDGLLIDPCLPRAIPHAKITRVFRGTRYEIEITNSGTARSISMDGSLLDSNLLPSPDGGHHVIKVTI